MIFIEREYPDFIINVKREQELVENHDNIIFQFPLYWYSSPSLLKKWIDLSTPFIPLMRHDSHDNY